MKKLNNKGFLLVETIVVATFTLTVLIALFLQFKNLLVSYNGSYNYNTVEGIYNLNAVKDYVMQYQNSENPLNKQLKSSNVPFLVLYKDGSCNTELETAGLNYCDELMKLGNFETVIFSSSDPTKLKEYLKSNENANISEEMKNLIKRLEKVDNQNRLVAEYKDGTLATIVFGVDNINTPAEPTPTPDPEEPTPSITTVYRWDTKTLNLEDSIEGTETTTTAPTNRKYYLKHDIENNIIKASYVCFVTDKEYCMQGGSADYYETNKELLQNQQTWFTSNSGSCQILDTHFSCNGGSFYRVNAFADGSVVASIPLDSSGDSTDGCYVYSNGSSYCREVRPA